MTPEEKQKFSEHSKKLWLNGTLVAARGKAAETYNQRYADGEYDFTERNEKLSVAITQKYLDGGFEWAAGQYVSTKTGKTCNYRSSWELRFMQILDADSRVEVWEHEPFSIPYEFDGVKKRYLPDFQVVLEGKDLLVEVKPPTLTDTPLNAAKRAAALEFCRRNGWEYLSWNLDEESTELKLTPTCQVERG